MVSSEKYKENDFEIYNINELMYFLYSLNNQCQVNMILYSFCEERFNKDIIKGEEINKLIEDIRYTMLSSFNILCQLTSKFSHFGIEKHITEQLEKMKKQFVFEQNVNNEENTKSNSEVELLQTTENNLIQSEENDCSGQQMDQNQIEAAIKKLNKKKLKSVFPPEYKQKVVELTNYKEIPDLAKQLQISKKNIERWKYQGIKRKKGAGRKTGNPELEQFLVNWVLDEIKKQNQIPRKKNIIAKAKEFNIANFKASKGWCDKFIKRNLERFQNLLDKTEDKT